jgi:hypothetical protein
MIPLGLYRTTKVNLMSYKDLDVKQTRKKGTSNSNQKNVDSSKFKSVKYVVTNPDQDTRLEKDDLVFVLAKQDPGDPETWDDYNENNKIMFDQNQNNLMGNINDMCLNKPQKNQNEFKEKAEKGD